MTDHETADEEPGVTGRDVQDVMMYREKLIVDELMPYWRVYQTIYSAETNIQDKADVLEDVFDVEEMRTGLRDRRIQIEEYIANEHAEAVQKNLEELDNRGQ